MNNKNDIAQTAMQDIKNSFSINGIKYSILYVDDERGIRNTFAEEMQDLGINVILTSSGGEALKALEKNSDQILLIISDIQMPGMDGFKLREEAQMRFPQIPFCIVSAHIDREMALRGVELKIAAFLPKPLNIKEILSVIQTEAIPRLNSLKDEYEFKQSCVVDFEPLLEESEEIILRLEQSFSDIESINRFYSIMHTIKGPSGFFEPKTLHKFVHAYEDLIKKIQRNEISHSQSVTNVLIRGFDIIKELVNELKTGLYSKVSLESLISELEVTPEEKDLTKPDANNTDGPRQSKDSNHNKARSQEDIKVSVNLLDEFMQLSGEVTVIRNMLNKCVSSIERRFAGDHDVGMLTELLDELHKINSGVQNKMTEIRKVPIKSVVKMLPRAIRDVAKSLNKKIELEISGDDLRVDTSIADVLNNSLLHIIKNSIDHGIESPEERIKNGKSDTGKVKVSATTRDDKVYLEISDDGKGLNVEAIKSKLIKNGTHNLAQIEEMSKPELYSMIFSAGFSTASQVTEISGRGVGMSMVKDCVDSVGGQIIIQSNPGVGASFTLELPVPKSVLIASCLSVLIGSRRFSLVQDDIIRVLQYNKSQQSTYVKNMEQAEFLVFNDELIPIADIGNLLKLNQTRTEKECRRFVLMRSGQDYRLMAIEVDEIFDVEDMVIKSMHNTLNSLSIYRGVTFLDDGGVGLILNTSGIMDALNIGRSRNKISTTEKSSSHTVEQNGDRGQVVTVRISNEDIFAIPESAIYRIEEISADAIKLSGRSRIVPYRGSPLKVEQLDRFTFKNTFSDTPTLKSNSSSGKIFLIVISKGANRLGLIVEEIQDIMPYDKVNRELSQAESGIEGHILMPNRTIPLLNLEMIWNTMQKDFDAFNDNDSSDEETQDTERLAS